MSQVVSNAQAPALVGTRQPPPGPGMHRGVVTATSASSPVFPGASPKNSGEGGIGRCSRGLGSQPWYDEDPRSSDGVQIPAGSLRRRPCDGDTSPSHLLRDMRVTGTWQGFTRLTDRAQVHVSRHTQGNQGSWFPPLKPQINDREQFPKVAPAPSRGLGGHMILPAAESDV